MYAPPELSNYKPRDLFNYINFNNGCLPLPKELMESPFSFSFPPSSTPIQEQIPAQASQRAQIPQERASTSSQALSANTPINRQSNPPNNANNNTTAASSSNEISPLLNFDFHPNDFGHVIKRGAENLTDDDRYRFLTDFYTPPNPPQHDWPSEVRPLKGKNVVRRLNPSTLSRADCATMAYSPMYKGLFCRNCAVFPPSKPQISKSLFIKKPFVRFSHMFGNGGAVKKHVLRKYHLEACNQAEQFVQKYKENSLTPTNPNILLGQMITSNINAINGGNNNQMASRSNNHNSTTNRNRNDGDNNNRSFERREQKQ